MFIDHGSTPFFSPVGTICVTLGNNINIASLPNQHQMRLGEYAFGIRHDLSGLKRVRITFFYKHTVPTGLNSSSTNIGYSDKPFYVKQLVAKSELAELVYNM